MQKEKIFSWTGITLKGKEITGEIKAYNRRFAHAQLESENVQIKKLKRKFSLSRFVLKKISSKSITLLIKQLSTMYTAGITLSQSLSIILQGIKDIHLRRLIQNAAKTVSEGHPLSFALQKHPNYFDSFTCQLIRAGESSGQLDKLLQQIINYRENIENIKRKIVGALIYPACISFIAILVIALFMIFIVPQFNDFFESFNAPLPLITRCLIYSSQFLKENSVIIFLAVILLIGLFTIFRKYNSCFTRFTDKLIEQIPFIKNIVKSAAVIRFTKTLQILYAAGIPLVDALELINALIPQTLLQNALEKIIQMIKQGHSLSYSLKKTQYFSSLLIQMILIGEESGRLEEMLNKATVIYEIDLNQLIDKSIQLLEPFIIVILGVIISIIVIAIYLPILQLGELI